MGSEALLDTDREVIPDPETQPVGTLTRTAWKGGDTGQEGEGRGGWRAEDKRSPGIDYIEE